MEISAKITGIKYKPLLCRKLNIFNFKDVDKALSKYATFILKIDDKNQIALSWWVSAKRTRSYPYARVYDSLEFSGKKITIIPIFKDEGKEGDRDFLQWDTVSLMSLLGVYVIIGYYVDASKSSRYNQKITDQRFDIDYIKSQINKILSYQSDALHWNLAEIDKVREIGRKALESYQKISKKLDVEMHSLSSAEKKIEELMKDKVAFMSSSRDLAQKAQKRESVTIQPKELLAGTKATLTIKNYLGGNYYFTSDEVRIEKDNLFLVEGKHTKQAKLPALEDTKDGLLKMILFTNLKEVNVNGKTYNPIPVLKLTTGKNFDMKSIKESQKEMLNLLKKESSENNFKLII